MKVFITTAYGEDQEPFRVFRKFADSDSFRIHQPVDSPAAADLVVFIENSQYDDDITFRRLRSHPLVRQSPSRCFMHNEQDHPFLALPGVYTALPDYFFDPAVAAVGPYLYPLNPAIGQAREMEPDLLFSFQGRPNCQVRRDLLSLQHPRAVLRGTAAFNPFFTDYQKDPTYFDDFARTLGRSKFVLCPRGVATSSIRFFEVLQAGRVPVVLSDHYVFPAGPDWNEIALRIPERDFAQLPARLEAEEAGWQRRAQAARQAWEQWYAPEVLFHRMVESCLAIQAARQKPSLRARALPAVTTVYMLSRHHLRPRTRLRALLNPPRKSGAGTTK